MPDAYSQRGPLPDGWHDAFAALPLEQPPGDGWSRLATRLHARQRPQWGRRLAVAAALVIAVALPWRLHTSQDPSATGHIAAPVAATGTSKPATASLDQLYAESAQLESLLQVARDDRVSSGAAAAMSSELDARVSAIDAALMQPGLSPERQLWLWRGRVEALRSLASFESNRRWLAANGERYDGAVARVD
jgi:hypothetical protein